MLRHFSIIAVIMTMMIISSSNSNGVAVIVNSSSNTDECKFKLYCGHVCAVDVSKPLYINRALKRDSQGNSAINRTQESLLQQFTPHPAPTWPLLYFKAR